VVRFFFGWVVVFCDCRREIPATTGEEFLGLKYPELALLLRSQTE